MIESLIEKGKNKPTKEIKYMHNPDEYQFVDLFFLF